MLHKSRFILTFVPDEGRKPSQNRNHKHQALDITVKSNTMTRQEYKEKSKTSEGRKNLHTEMLDIIKARMDSFLKNAPEANKPKIERLFEVAMNNIKDHGNSLLFDFFADEKISDREFIRNVQIEIKG